MPVDGSATRTVVELETRSGTMSNPRKNKGDTAEREIAARLNALTGWPVRRKLGAGRLDDAGDLDGIPDCTAQVKNHRDITRGIREAINQLEDQRNNAGTTFAVAFIRRLGGRWIAVQTLEGWATSHREATEVSTKSNPSPGHGFAHDFNCTHDPCHCQGSAA